MAANATPWRDLFNFQIQAGGTAGQNANQNWLGGVTPQYSGGGQEGQTLSGYNFDPSALAPGNTTMADFAKGGGITYNSGGASGGQNSDSNQHFDINYSNAPSVKVPWKGGQSVTAAGLMPVDLGPDGKPATSVLLDPKKVYNDPNYGWVTTTDNYNQAHDKLGTAFATYLPMLAAGALGGMTFAGMGAGLAGGAGGLSSGAADTVATGLFKTAGNAVLGNNGGILGSLLNVAGGATGLPGGSMIGNLLNIARGSGGTSARGAPRTTGGQMNKQMSPLMLLLLLSQVGKGGKTGGGG